MRFDLVEGQRKPRCGFGPLAQYILLKAFESLTDWNVTPPSLPPPKIVAAMIFFLHWQYLVKSDIWFPAPAYDVDEPELPSPYCAELQGESLLTNVSLAYLDVLVSLPPSPKNHCCNDFFLK